MIQRIVFLDRATIAPQIRVRPPSFAHELIEHAETRADQVAERLAGASIAITNKAPITDATLARLPALKLVAVAATGTDCVDKAACAARGLVAPAPLRFYRVAGLLRLALVWRLRSQGAQTARQLLLRAEALLDA